jgi:hypothetical protein
MKYYHFFPHIHKQVVALLLSVVISFHLTTLIGGNQSVVSAVISSEIYLGFLISGYLRWGYDLSPRERSHFREFFIGMLPAWAVHFLFCLVMYALASFFYGKKIFKILPILSIAVNTPPLGIAFSLSEMEVLSLREDMENIPNTLPKTVLPLFLLCFFIMVFVCILISYGCYRRGVFLQERERKEMLLGIQRKKKGPLAARFWFVPLVNIVPIFSYLYRHLFLVEYRIRDAVFPMFLIVAVKIILSYLVSYAISCVPTIWMYYLAHFLDLWLWGILISRFVLSKEKERKNRE